MKYISEEELRKWIITDGCVEGHGYIDEDDINSMDWIEDSKNERQRMFSFLDGVAEGLKHPIENTGNWIIYDVHGHDACKCSECNTDIGYENRHYKYCPYCGAKMG